MIINIINWLKKKPIRPAFSIALLFHILLALFTFQFPENTDIGDDAVNVFQMQASPPSSTAKIQKEKKRPVDPNAFSDKKIIEKEEESNPDDPNLIEQEAYDLSFSDLTGGGVQAPKLRSRLPKCYPPIARKDGIEASTLSELILNKEGVVVKVNIIGIKLNKTLPSENKNEIIKLFSNCIILAFKGAQFTPPYVNDKNVAIKMEQPLNFSLEN